MNCINWYQAKTYCQWLGGQFPTEAQWEYAATGNQSLRYPWGNSSDPNLIYQNCVEGSCHDGFSETSPVGSFPLGASPFGLFDMMGNTVEWVRDWSAASGLDYPASPQVDPTGPASDSYKVIRGAHWGNGLRSNYWRFRIVPTSYGCELGFRCVVGGP